MADVVHSELGASSYERWGSCPGSVRLSRDIPKKTSSYAEEGSLAHDIAAKILLNPKHLIGGVEEETLNAILTYVNFIQILREHEPDFEAVEQKLDLSQYHPKLFGTADYVCYYKNDKTLHVVDYKHGAGVAVEVENNSQLMYYGLGALHMNKFPIRRIILTIVQPRCYHVAGPIRHWQTDPMTMLEFSAALIDDANKTEKPDASLNPGDHCRWCPASAVCPEIHKNAIVAAQEAFTPATSYDPEKLAATLLKLDQIEAWAKSVRSFAYSEAEAGRIPPGFKLVDKRATRKWKDGVEVSTLVDALDLAASDCHEIKFKSPAQIEKIITKAQKPMLDSLTLKESSGKNLVPISDDRPEVLAKAQSVFDTIATN